LIRKTLCFGYFQLQKWNYWIELEQKELVKLKNLEILLCFFFITPCCCRDVGDGEGAGEALEELGLSDTKEPLDSFILEFRFWTLVVLDDDTWRLDMSRDGWHELGVLQSTKPLALWAERADSLVGLLPDVIETQLLDQPWCSSRTV
jgi:hypothetical protein